MHIVQVAMTDQRTGKATTSEDVQLQLHEIPSSSDLDSDEEDGKGACYKKCLSWLSQCRENWKKILVVVILWLAYMLCNVAFSIIAPFFPKIVSIQLATFAAAK